MAQETVPPARSKHALIFGIDGCRADALKLAVETGKAPHIAELIRSGTVTWNAYACGELDKPTQQITLSAPGWSSIFTAVWHDKHGVTDNTFRGANFARYPNFIEHVRKATKGCERRLPSRWTRRYPPCVSSAARTDPRRQRPELISSKLVAWCEQNGVRLHHIQPGKPTQNAYIERFNTMRREVLDANLFANLAEVRETIHHWMISYNEERPYASLGNLPPRIFKQQLTNRTKTTEAA